MGVGVAGEKLKESEHQAPLKQACSAPAKILSQLHH